MLLELNGAVAAAHLDAGLAEERNGQAPYDHDVEDSKND